jgi:plasmid stability protein
MPVTLSIRNVPDDVAERIRSRAKRNHRSVQGELMALISGVTNEMGLQDERREFVSQPLNRKLSPVEALKQMRALGVRTKDEVTQMIREDRDR